MDGHDVIDDARRREASFVQARLAEMSVLATTHSG
jgi:hypothetical protein